MRIGARRRIRSDLHYLDFLGGQYLVELFDVVSGVLLDLGFGGAQVVARTEEGFAAELSTQFLTALPVWEAKALDGFEQFAHLGSRLQAERQRIGAADRQ